MAKQIFDKKKNIQTSPKTWKLRSLGVSYQIFIRLMHKMQGKCVFSSLNIWQLNGTFDWNYTSQRMNDRGEMKRMSSFVGEKMRNIKIVKLIRSFWMLLMVLANQPNYSFCCTFPILERLFFVFVAISTVLLSEFSCSSFMCIFDILTIVHSFKIFPIWDIRRISRLCLLNAEHHAHWQLHTVQFIFPFERAAFLFHIIFTTFTSMSRPLQ